MVSKAGREPHDGAGGQLLQLSNDDGLPVLSLAKVRGKVKSSHSRKAW